MAKFTSPAQLQAQMQKRASAATYAMRTAHKDLYTGGREDHAQYTSGRVSSRQLRQMGHPFGRKTSGDVSTGARGIVGKNAGLSAHAKRKGNKVRKGVLNPLPINKQSGKMRQSYFQTPESGPDLIVDMGYRAPHARHVLSPTGTRLMVARGFYSVGNSVSSLGIVAKRHRARKAGIQAAARKKILFP